MCNVTTIFNLSLFIENVNVINDDLFIEKYMW